LDDERLGGSQSWMVLGTCNGLMAVLGAVNGLGVGFGLPSTVLRRSVVFLERSEEVVGLSGVVLVSPYSPGGPRNNSTASTLHPNSSIFGKLCNIGSRSSRAIFRLPLADLVQLKTVQGDPR